MMKRILIAMGALAILAVSTAYPADFLSGARGGGMGFSYFVMADDPSGALYNPSALGYIKGWQTQFMYEKINSYDYRPVAERPYSGRFGITYYYPQMGTFALNSLQSGSFADKTNIPTVNQVAVSYGRELSPLWSTGGSVKYLSEMGFGKRSAFDMDLSLSLRTDIGVAAALAFENITRAQLTPEYNGVREYLPRRSRIGAGYFLAGDSYEGALIGAAQLEESGISQKQTTSLFNLGTEWWFAQNKPFSFAVRTGYTVGKAIRNDIKSDYTSPTAGVSVNYNIAGNDCRLDYSWQAFPFTTVDGSTPGNHFISLTVGWGGVPSYPSREKGVSVQPVKIEEKPKPQEKPVETPQIFQPPKNDEQDEKPLNDKDTNFGASEVKLFNVEMEVNDISSMDLKRVVFYVRPQQVIKSTSWKLYVFKAKIKNWSDEEVNRWALASIEGKGVPPINIVWDGADAKGEMVSKGKYYFIMTAIDIKGQRYATDWFTFKLE